MTTPREQLLAAVGYVERVQYAPRWDDPRIAGKGVFEPRFVVLHHTAGTNSLQWLASGCDHKPVPGAHFLVARDGLVHVLTRSLAYHAGIGGPSHGVAHGMMNHYAWGIEIESLGLSRDLTDAQIVSVARLTAGLCDAMNVGTVNVINHRDWSTTGKTDTLYDASWWRERVDPYRNINSPVQVPQNETSRVPAPFPGHSFGYGERGAHVERLQRALGIRPTDGKYGYFGPITRRKVKAFQRVRPWLWPANGVVGPKTYAAIVGE